MDFSPQWQAVLGELEVKISRASFATWFKHTGIVENSAGRVVIAVPNIFNKEWLEKKFHRDIRSALEKVLGPISKIEYKVMAPAQAASPKPVDSLQPKAAAVSKTAHPSLNSRYTFDNFVVGASNELAYAACKAVAASPGHKYNPLFIYGGTGLGKTHLIQAVGHEILRRDPHKKIEYVTSESFTSEFIASVVRHKSGFTNKYRQVDVLIVDDMQFLGGKEKTQEEFFHTFNALHHTNRQIIISSDKSPRSIAGLEGRLRSRFESGMTCDIGLPEFETRAAIVQSKAQAQGIELDADVTELLAKQFTASVRELEGALTQLLAWCELRGTEPTLNLAQELLATSELPRRRRLTAKQVLDQTAKYFEIPAKEIVGPKRDKEIVTSRQVAMYLMRQELNLSFPRIAAEVGGRDHTTAIHSVGKIAAAVEFNESLREDISAIRQKLTS